MFRRLNPAEWEWQAVLSIGAFALTVAVFTFFIVRALRMKRDVAERMSRLPVTDEDDEKSV